MKVMVTGGAGFVGTHLTNALVDLGEEVLVIDNLFTGRREWLNSKARFARLDLGIASDGELGSIVRHFDPHYVVHLAAIHYIPYCLAHPEQTFASNVRGTELLIRSLNGLGTKKIVGASTVDVYSTDDVIHREEDTLAPANPYGLSKLLSEQLLAYAARTERRLCAVSLRLSNIYGPLETNPHLIPRVLKLLDTPEVLELRMGYLGGTRDFIHVFDVVSAILAVLFNDTGKYDCFNVSTGTPTSARRVVEILQREAGDTRPVIEDETQFRKFDRKSLSSDVSKIYKCVGWKARIQIEDGLAFLRSTSSAISSVRRVTLSQFAAHSSSL